MRIRFKPHQYLRSMMKLAYVSFFRLPADYGGEVTGRQLYTSGQKGVLQAFSSKKRTDRMIMYVFSVISIRYLIYRLSVKRLELLYTVLQCIIMKNIRHLKNQKQDKQRQKIYSCHRKT